MPPSGPTTHWYHPALPATGAPWAMAIGNWKPRLAVSRMMLKLTAPPLDAAAALPDLVSSEKALSDHLGSKMEEMVHPSAVGSGSAMENGVRLVSDSFVPL